MKNMIAGRWWWPVVQVLLTTCTILSWSYAGFLLGADPKHAVRWDLYWLFFLGGVSCLGLTAGNYTEGFERGWSARP